MKQQGVIFRASTHRYHILVVQLVSSTIIFSRQKNHLLLFALSLFSICSILFTPIFIQSTVLSSQQNTEQTPVQAQYEEYHEPNKIEQQDSNNYSFADIATTESIEPQVLIPPVQAATTQVTTLPSPQQISTSLQFILPLPFYTSLSSSFSYSHPGIDLTAPAGTPVYAGANGTVIEAGWSTQGYGLSIVIDHGNGMKSRYAHLSSIAVNPSQTISQGTVIGNVGCTGWCTGNHLHLEVHHYGVAVNPFSYVPL